MKEIRNFFDRSFTLGQSLAWVGLAIAVATLGAHFYRAGEYGIVLCAGGMLFFLCANSAWKQYAVAFFLLWGMLEWGESAYALAKFRTQLGLPWVRGGAILIAVALVTGLAGRYAFSRARDKDSGPSPAFFQGIVFMATFLALFYLRQSVKMNFLLLERYLPLLGSVQIFLAAWYAAFIGGKLVDPRQSRKTRRVVWLVFGIIFFAQFFLGVAGVDRMLLTGKLHVPIPAFIIFAPIFRDAMSMMPVIVLVATLLAGSSWCSMLCYFGPFDALAAGGKAVRPYPAFLRAALQYGRLFILVTGSLAALGLRAWGLSTSGAISIAVVYAVLSLLIMAVFSKKYAGMAHCTTACPLGLLANILGRLSPWRVRVSTSSCDNCGACDKICKYSAITPESRARGKTLLRCSLCRDCISICKNKAIFLYFPGLSPQAAWLALVGLTTVLHALFLSVAMV